MNNEAPKITVIIPMYKAETYIHQCVDSIIKQTYTNLEIILVNDGSPDRCGIICDEYAEKDRRIKVIHKENGGVSSARNVGLENASGEHIQFVDSDDYIVPTMCEALWNAMKKDHADLVICNFNRVDDNSVRSNGNFEDAIFGNMGEFEKMFLYYYKRGLIKGPWNKLYKKSLCGKFEPHISNGEDAVFNFDYLSKCRKITVVGECLYNVRNNEDSATNQYRKNIDKEMELLFEKTRKFSLENFSEEFNKSHLSEIYFRHIKIILNHYALQDKKKVRNILRSLADCEMIKKMKYRNLGMYDKIFLFCSKRKAEMLLIALIDSKERYKKIRRG